MFDRIDLIVQTAGFGAFLWLAFFILSRADRQRAQTILTFAGLFSVAVLLFSLGLINNTDGPAYEWLVRVFWWSDVLPVAFWFHITSQILRREAKPLFTVPVLLVYGLAAVISLLGMATDLFINYSGAVKSLGTDGQESIFYPNGVAYPFYVAYIGLTLLTSLWYIGRTLYRDRTVEEGRAVVLRWEHRLLFAGGVLFLVGALYQTLRVLFGSQIWEWPGHLILISGLGLLGYSVSQFDMMMEGKNVKKDFAYSLTGVIIINLLYVAMLSFVGGLNTQSLLVLVGLTTTTHSLFDFGRQLLDRLFFSQAEQEARSDARSYATALASQPVPTATPETSLELESVDPEDEKNFRNVVRKAITSLKNPTQLAKSPLLSLRLVERRLQEVGLEDNRLNRATVLRGVLRDSIEQLRPDGLSGDNSEPGTGDAWRFYNVLYLPYVREYSRKGALTEARRLEIERKRNGHREPGELEQVLAWLSDIDEDTFYKWQRKASDTIATLLREEELRLLAPLALNLNGVVPATAIRN